ncbi:hypothetical protein HK098_003566 [Nowakowskiella sp. JEL0407]|nr:hypothetical protein HK098_003566 [Nowakowskiella sp. JEL0407]
MNYRPNFLPQSNLQHHQNNKNFHYQDSYNRPPYQNNFNAHQFSDTHHHRDSHSWSQHSNDRTSIFARYETNLNHPNVPHQIASNFAAPTQPFESQAHFQTYNHNGIGASPSYRPNLIPKNSARISTEIPQSSPVSNNYSADAKPKSNSTDVQQTPVSDTTANTKDGLNKTRRTPIACDTCHDRKLKCLGGDSSTKEPCDRCSKSKRPCIWSESRLNTKRAKAASKMARLAQDISEMEGQQAQQQNSHQPQKRANHGYESPSVSTPLPEAYPPVNVPDSSPQKRQRIESSPSVNPRPNYVPISTGSNYQRVSAQYPSFSYAGSPSAVQSLPLSNFAKKNPSQIKNLSTLAGYNNVSNYGRTNPVSRLDLHLLASIDEKRIEQFIEKNESMLLNTPPTISTPTSVNSTPGSRPQLNLSLSSLQSQLLDIFFTLIPHPINCLNRDKFDATPHRDHNKLLLTSIYLVASHAYMAIDKSGSSELISEKVLQFNQVILSEMENALKSPSDDTVCGLILLGWESCLNSDYPTARRYFEVIKVHRHLIDSEKTRNIWASCQILQQYISTHSTPEILPSFTDLIPTISQSISLLPSTNMLFTLSQPFSNFLKLSNILSTANTIAHTFSYVLRPASSSAAASSTTSSSSTATMSSFDWINYITCLTHFTLYLKSWVTSLTAVDPDLVVEPFEKNWLEIGHQLALICVYKIGFLKYIAKRTKNTDDGYNNFNGNRRQYDADEDNAIDVDSSKRIYLCCLESAVNISKLIEKSRKVDIVPLFVIDAIFHSSLVLMLSIFLSPIPTEKKTIEMYTFRLENNVYALKSFKFNLASRYSTFISSISAILKHVSDPGPYSSSSMSTRSMQQSHSPTSFKNHQDSPYPDYPYNYNYGSSGSTSNTKNVNKINMPNESRLLQLTPKDPAENFYYDYYDNLGQRTLQEEVEREANDKGKRKDDDFFGAQEGAEALAALRRGRWDEPINLPSGVNDWGTVKQIVGISE